MAGASQFVGRNSASAKKFKVFGWQPDPVPVKDGVGYRTLHKSSIDNLWLYGLLSCIALY